MSLSDLLENPRVWRGSGQFSARTGLASGYPRLDRCLPGGGWPLEALTEILIGQYGIGRANTATTVNMQSLAGLPG